MPLKIREFDRWHSLIVKNLKWEKPNDDEFERYLGMLRPILYLKRKKKTQNKTKTYQKQKERACKDHFIKAVKRRVKERDMI